MSGESDQLRQDEIEQLLARAKQSQGGSAPAAPAAEAPQAAAPAEDEGAVVGQSEIDALLKQVGKTATVKKPAEPPRVAAAATSDGSLPASDVELLLAQAEAALASIGESPSDSIPGLRQFKLDDFSGAPPSTETATLELIRDVALDVRIELGRTRMYLEDVLRLRKGAVVSLDKLAGDPVDIYVNGRHVARGEVLVLNDNFCVRVAELIAGQSARAG